MNRLDEFLHTNRLKQVDLANYLSVTKGYISLVLQGKKSLSKENLRKLIDNPHGWDVSMLASDQPKNPVGVEPSGYHGKDDAIIILREMLAEERSRNDALQERINELIEENARLKTQIEGERKGGVA